MTAGAANQLPPAVSLRRWTLWLCYCCCIIATGPTGTTAVTYDLFAQAEELHLTGGAGTQGSIVSTGYPRPISRGNLSRIPEESRVLLTTCRDCRISLAFVGLSLPHCRYTDMNFYRAVVYSSYCELGCTYVYVHSPHYQYTTRRFIRSSLHKPDDFWSEDSSIVLAFCKGGINDNVSFKIDFTIHAVIGVTHVMFRETESTLEGEVGTRGTIVSPFYPLPIDSVILSHLHRTSTLLLTACPECRISLTFTNVSLPECDLNEYDYRSIPSSDYCSQACNYLVVYDPHYENETRRYVTSLTSTPVTFVSESRAVQLVFCKTPYSTFRQYISFSIDFPLQDKIFTADSTRNGSLMSPNYPGPYALNGDVYEYLIYSPGKYIRLTFDGWDLSGASIIQVFYKNSEVPGADIKSFFRRGTGTRIIGQSFEYFKLVFTAETDTDPSQSKRAYLGFHANYEYVPRKSWQEFPRTVCGEYFHHQLGGHFESNAYVSGPTVDCLWVIGPPSEVGATNVLLKFEENHRRAWELEIRRGVTSDAPLAYSSSADQNPFHSGSVDSSSGIYIRLKYEYRALAFKATFAYYVRPLISLYCRKDKYKFKCDSTDRCISTQLRCDGFDHCGDDSDEMHCSGTTTLYACPFGETFSCDHFESICADRRCDGVEDCYSGLDEENCYSATDKPEGKVDRSFSERHWSTIVPSVLVSVIVIIVVCISITWYMQCKRRNRRLEHARVRMRHLVGSRGNVPAISNEQGNWQGQGMTGEERLDAPPTYHDAVLYSPSAGTVNLAYTISDSLDPHAKPPPYSPTLGLECVPPPAYEHISPQAPTDYRPETLTQGDANPSVVTNSPQAPGEDYEVLHGAREDHGSSQELMGDRSQGLTDDRRRSPAVEDDHEYASLTTAIGQQARSSGHSGTMALQLADSEDGDSEYGHVTTV